MDKIQAKNTWICDHCGAEVPTGIINVSKHVVEDCPVTAKVITFTGKPITKEEFESVLKEVFSEENRIRMLQQREEYYKRMWDRARAFYGEELDEVFKDYIKDQS